MRTLPPDPDEPPIHEPRLWRDDGWTATVIKNEDDEGWAVAMTLRGQAEPALVGPWTMGRDKKNPKPLDNAAFLTLVKTASEVLRRHEQQLHALHHKSLWVDASELSAFDAAGERVAQVRVAAGFKLNLASAAAWVEGGFARPR